MAGQARSSSQNTSSQFGLASAYVAPSQQTVPTRQRKASARKPLSLRQLVLHASALLLLSFAGFQLLRGVLTMGVQLSQLSLKVPQAHWINGQAAEQNKSLKHAIAQVRKREGIERLAREQLDYAAQDEVLIRLL
jgi:cell division protein FtsB